MMILLGVIGRGSSEEECLVADGEGMEGQVGGVDGVRIPMSELSASLSFSATGVGLRRSFDWFRLPPG